MSDDQRTGYIRRGESLAEQDAAFFRWQASHPDMGPAPTSDDSCVKCSLPLVWDGFDGTSDLFICPADWMHE